MASKSIQSLIDSLSRDRLEAAYEIPGLREMREVLRILKEGLPEKGAGAEEPGEPGETGDGAEDAFEPDPEALERLKQMEEEIAEIAASPSGKPVPFVFVKLTSRQYNEAMEWFNEQYSARKNERLKNLADRRRQVFAQMLENESLSSDGDRGEVERSTKEMLAAAILELEGKTEDWAGDIDPDDPEMQLSEEQEKAWNLSPDMPEDQYVEVLEKRQRNIEGILEAKRANIREGRERDIEDRRKELMAKDPDKLVNQLVVREIDEEAKRHATMRLQDYFLFMSARNPEDIETVRNGSITRKDPRRHFGSVDEVTSLRESDDEIENDIYAWMLTQYQELQWISNSGDIRRVAESQPFPAAV